MKSLKVRLIVAGVITAMALTTASFSFNRWVNKPFSAKLVGPGVAPDSSLLLSDAGLSSRTHHEIKIVLDKGQASGTDSLGVSFIFDDAATDSMFFLYSIQSAISTPLIDTWNMNFKDVRLTLYGNQYSYVYVFVDP